MNEQHIPQPEDRTEDEQQQLIKQLKDSIELSHQQMHQLLLNEDAFVDKITSFNNAAKDKINQKGQLQISQALVYLNEAQIILQYAAGCGKNINRELIICVLHNQACVYQILWELEQCSNYLEALIYNYETFFKETNEFSLPPSCINPGSQINADGEKMFGFAGGSEISYVSKMKDPRIISRAELKLLVYYFEHCAVKSQRQQNNRALESAKKGIKVLKNSFYEQKAKLLEEMSTHKTYLSQASETMYFLLQQLSEIAEKISIDDKSIKSITKSAHFSLQIWSNNRTFNSQLDKQENAQTRMKQKLRHLAIGTIMEIVPNAYEKIACEAIQDDPQESILSMDEYMLRVFFLSVGYFSVATELRILSISLYKGRKEEDRKNSHEFKESMVYHLIAIIIASLYIPYECRYIDDVLASYAKHYACNLEEYKPVEKESIQKIIQLMGFKMKQEDNLVGDKAINLNANVGNSANMEKSKSKTELNEYNMNCKHTPITLKYKTLKKKQKQHLTFKQYSEQPSSQTQKLKYSKTDLKSSQTKKSRAQSKNQQSKRSHSKQTVNIKDKIQKKYSELQKILSNQNLITLDQGPKSPIKKTKTDKNGQKGKEKQKSHTQLSKDMIKIKKMTDKDKDKNQAKCKHKKCQNKHKTERKTKNSQKKQEQKQQQKPNSITEEDEQFFFYMTKKTTKTTNANANGIFSPKQSIKSIGSSRKSTNKKSSMYSSRSNSKNSPRVFGQSPVAGINSPLSPKGFGGIKKIMGDKKSPTGKTTISLYNNYC